MSSFSAPAVENLELSRDGDTLTASWDEFSKQACTVQYKVSYFNGNNMVRELNTEDPELSVELPYCSADRIEVVTIMDDFESTTLVEAVPCKLHEKKKKKTI